MQSMTKKIYKYEKTEVRPVNVGALPNTKEKKY